jgi:threonine dehydratase
VSADLNQSARTSPPVSAADIDAATQRISDVVTRTPLQLSERLSEAVGATVYLKR